MFEDQTKAAILARMLAASPPDIDKREGSPTFDLLSPAAIELALAYIELNNVLNFGFPDTSYGPYLDLSADEYGLTRKPAVKATGSLTFSGPNGTVIPVGTQASTSDADPIYFVTTAAGTISGGSVTVSAEARDAGAAGNVSVGAVNTVTGDLVGIVTVTNAVNFEGGADTESDDALRARILDRAARPATSGNANHYRQWALEVPGISDAKVTPIWDGPGTVRVALLDDNKTAPDATTVQAVQDYIDPTQDGTGQGVAPIGAACTVVGATEVPIDVSVTVTLAPGGTVDEVKTGIEDGVREYLASIAFVDNQLTGEPELVRYTQFGQIVLAIPPVIDYSNLLVNGGTSNISLTDGEVAVLGTVVVTA